jgi:tryptophan halogenase
MTDKSRRTKHVLIVGGGTAGWLTACHLARALNGNSPDGVKVTLVESANIPTIGVGEGTVPAIRGTFEHLGIRETDFVRECDVTFKQSIKFVDWLHAPGQGAGHAYHHVFDYLDRRALDPTPYWLMGHAGHASFANAVSVQEHLCEGNFGPKVMTHAEYDGAVNYAYHLDAAKLAAFLTRHATEKLGVVHKLANVTDVKLSDGGDIAAVVTDDAGTLEADMFIDCTGFAALLIEKKLGIGFIPKDDVLFVDHALAAQVPYVREDEVIPCHTIATAQEAGWIWDIGLSARRGTGYVYSSKHTDHDQAEAVLRTYLRKSVGELADRVECRRIPMRIGYREQYWVKNCVAVGLSQGFVEPLEATGILIYDATARMLAEQFPAHRAAMDTLAPRFNARVRNAWDRVIDFIKLHYCLSKRDDSQFWRDNRDEASIPASLLENLAVWRDQVPSAYDFSSKLDVFGLDNYLYVLYGMGFETAMEPLQGRCADADIAKQFFKQMRGYAEHLSSELLPHRELIARIKQYGLQRV